MPRIVLEGHIVVPDNDLPAVLAALPIHIELTCKEQGCLRFEVKQNPERPNDGSRMTRECQVRFRGGCR